MLPFPDALALTPEGDGAAAFTATIHPDWAQGRAAFGGLQAALAARAIARHVPEGRALRSLLVSFTAMVSPGPLRIEVVGHRHGKSLSHAEARLVQGGELRATVIAAYGAARASSVRWDAPAANAVPPPDDVPVFPYVQGITPAFTRHFDYRWTSEAMPFTRAPVGHIGGWFRHAGDVAIDEAAVIALADAWPPPLLPLLGRPAPASTVTWMMNLVAPIPTSTAPRSWWRFEGTTIAAQGGYGDVEGRIWSPSGQLVATSRQLVAEFS